MMFEIHSFYVYSKEPSLLFLHKDLNPDSLWRWVDGSKLDYSKWSKDSEKGPQPSYCCPEDELSYCGTVGSNGAWFDTGCIEDPTGPINFYICQKPKGSIDFIITAIDNIYV